MTISSSPVPLSPDAKALLTRVYGAFQKNHAWPSLREIQAAFGSDSNVRLLAVQAGQEYIVVDDSQSPRCMLRRAGIELLPEATEDLEMYAKALGLVGERYVDGTTSVSQDDFRLAFQLSDHSLARLQAMFEVFGGPWRTSGRGNADGTFHVDPSEEAHFFAGVSTYADAKRVWERQAAEQQLIRDKLYIRSPRAISVTDHDQSTREGSDTGFHLVDDALDAVFQRDLRELDAVRDIGAWKAASLLAGSCTEAVLLDLLLRHSEVRPGRHKNDDEWPRNGKLAELANAAAQAGLISADQKDMSAVFREWRDIIHPARAVQAREPTKELAEALHAYLRLLISTMNR